MSKPAWWYYPTTLLFWAVSLALFWAFALRPVCRWVRRGFRRYRGSD
jgi:hypothetical protein